uniref:Glycosyl transferase family 25 domain-containing protein n=1 Tax=Tetradesmus obliquus TaxID=3088 RepID=A0A383VQV5_TETOB|eukprot:jgi/Sobl393_1/19723/SZX67905.1
MRGVLRVKVPESKWKELEKAKRSMPQDTTYQNMTAQQLREELPVRVISLARATERRTTVSKILEAAGVSYELVDAVDAANTSIPLSDVKKFVRGYRLRHWKDAERYRFHRQKVAVDVSHYQNLDRILKENRTAVILEDDVNLPEAGRNKDAWYIRVLAALQELPQNLDRILKENRTAVILEDDVNLPEAGRNKDAWYIRVLAALQELPQDWDVLYVDTCTEKRGAVLGDHVRVARQALCTLGYIATPRFARKALAQDWDVLYVDTCTEKRGAVLGDHVRVARQALCTLGYIATPRFARKALAQVRTSNLRLRTPFVDLLYANMIEHLEVAGYVAAPPLAGFSSAKSTMDYAAAFANLTEWDKWVMGWRRLH